MPKKKQTNKQLLEYGKTSLPVLPPLQASITKTADTLDPIQSPLWLEPSERCLRMQAEGAASQDGATAEMVWVPGESCWLGEATKALRSSLQ